MIIDAVEFDVTEYEIIYDTEKSDTGEITTKFSVVIDGNIKSVKANYTSSMIDALSITVPDAESELKSILINEIKIEIFEHVSGERYIDQIQKLSKIYTEEKLQHLIDSDPVLKMFIRGFHDKKAPLTLDKTEVL